MDMNIDDMPENSKLNKLLKDLDKDINEIKKDSPEKAKQKRENGDEYFYLNDIKIVKK